MSIRYSRDVRHSRGGESQVFAEERRSTNPDGMVRVGLSSDNGNHTHGALAMTRPEATALRDMLTRLLEGTPDE